MKYIGIFQIIEPRNLLKPDSENSVNLLEFFDTVFNVVPRRMSSIIVYMCLYLHWGLFKQHSGKGFSV